MNSYVHEWIAFLRTTHGTTAFPLIVAGVALMAFGWRMWKLCVVLSFATIGGGLALAYLPDSKDRLMLAGLAAVLLGAISYWPARHAVRLLGGLLGGGAVMVYLGELGLRGTPLWCLAGVGFVLSTAFALIHHAKIVVLITAVLGSVLLVSGLTAGVMTTPSLYGWFSGLTYESVIVVPFLLIVPTVVSCFYQVGESRRMHLGV